MSDFLDLQGAKDLNTDAIHIGAVANSVDPVTGAQIDTHVNRVGGTDYTLQGFWNALGPVVMPWTSVDGGTLTQPNQAFLHPANRNYYSWGGVYPKVVAPGIDPAAVGSGYVPRTDVVFRAEITPSVLEALRRSYADAGFTLVDGSFEEGGTLTSASDVLLHKASGKAYSGHTGTVPAGTNPASGGFVDVSNSLSHPFDISIYGGINETLSALGTAYIYNDITLSEDVILSSGQVLKTVGEVVVTLGGHNIKTEGTETLPFRYYEGSPASPVLALASPISKGSTSLTLLDASSVNAGDLLWLQNGYCDFWRYFEDLTIPEVNKLFLIDHPIYFGEHVRVLSVSGNVVNLQSGTRFGYLLQPTLTGSLTDENALPQYAGLNTASVRRAGVSNVAISGKFDFSAGGGIFADAVDGLHLDIDTYGYSASEAAESRSFKQVRFDKCRVGSNGVKMSAVSLQQCSGAKVTGESHGWLGGSDAPYTTMLHSQNDIENVVLEALPSAGAIGAAYINSGGNCRISNIKSTNSRSVAICSYSKGVDTQNLTGINVDTTLNSYISVDCSCTNAVLDGYFSLTSATTSSRSLIGASRSLRFKASDIKRNNDLGYGLVKIDELSSGTVFDNIEAVSTDCLILIAAKGTEYAVGLRNDKAICTNMKVKNLIRNGLYFDSISQNNLNYPAVKFSGIVYGDATIGSNIVADEYDIYVHGNTTVGSGSTVKLSGVLWGNLSPTSASDAYTCFIDAKDLKIFGAVSSDFVPAPTTGLAWFPKGMCMTDFTTMKRWWHSGSFGAPGPMVQ